MGKIQEFREKVNGGRVAMPEKDIWKCLFAEFLGTFLLVLVGCGSATGFPEKIGEGGKQIPETAITPSLVAVSFCFALMVSTLAATIGHISAHLNPAVTIAFFVTGKIQLVKAVLYVIFQCVAAIVAIAFLQVLCPDPDPKFQYGYVELANKFTPVQGVGIEFFITFVLVFVICAFCDENRNDNIGAGPLAIGFALAAVIFFGGPLTGAGINPARVLGPCVILGKYTNHWIYWVGPIGGAIAAAVTYHFIFRVKDHEETKASDVDRRDRTDAQQRKDNGVAPEV